MTGHFQKLTFIMITALVVAFLLGPPLSLASKLPTVCNIFAKKSVDKACPCGHKAMFSKNQEKSFEVEGILFSSAGFKTSPFAIVQGHHPSFFLPFGSNAQTNPLRC